MKLAIVYWSGTGNTESIANDLYAIAKTKVDTSIYFVTDINESELKNFDVVLLGCPAQGAEKLDKEEFEPFYEKAKPYLLNKKIGLFGSHDWGNGEWMDEWQKDAINSKLNVVKTLMVKNENLENYSPEDFIKSFL